MFIVYGPGLSELYRPEAVFEQWKVAKLTKASPAKQVALAMPDSSRLLQDHEGGSAAERHYKTNTGVRETAPLLDALQIMSSPVVSVASEATVGEALELFASNDFRHLPVVCVGGGLIGIVSDSDLLQCKCSEGVSCRERQLQPIETMMSDRVLTASVDTDARHIARLFVERRIGALPIVKADHLVGIVTRSDVLRAVMHSLSLDVWR